MDLQETRIAARMEALMATWDSGMVEIVCSTPKAIDATLLPCHEPRHVTSEVLAVVAVGVENTHVAMTGKLLPAITPRKVERRGYRKMAKTMGADSEPALRSELAHNVLDSGPGKASRALLGAVEIEEDVLSSRAPRAMPRGQPSSAPGSSQARIVVA
jgi:hypothetical protein